MIRAAPILLLAGCPYVFGPADLSNVPGPGPGTTSPTGTTGDTAPDGPTGDTGPLVVPPAVIEVQALPVVEGLDLLVRFSPPGALDLGGTLLVSVDDTALYQLAVPGDVTLLSPEVVRWQLPVPDACEGVHHTIGASIRDPEGNVGASASVVVDLAGAGTVAEQGGAPTDLGELAPPVLLCGVGNGSWDYDRFMFRTATAGAVVFVLTWDGGQTSDLDFTIYEDGYYVGSVYGGYGVNPEILAGALSVGSLYDLEILQYAGAPPIPWQMAILPDPDATGTATSGTTGDTGP